MKMEAGVLFYTVIGTGFGRHWWLTDSFCQWRHNNNSITVKCIFTSIFLLHPAAVAHLFPSRRESHITCFHPCGKAAESALSLHSPSHGGLFKMKFMYNCTARRELPHYAGSDFPGQESNFGWIPCLTRPIICVQYCTTDNTANVHW